MKKEFHKARELCVYDATKKDIRYKAAMVSSLLKEEMVVDKKIDQETTSSTAKRRHFQLGAEIHKVLVKKLILEAANIKKLLCTLKRILQMPLAALTR